MTKFLIVAILLPVSTLGQSLFRDVLDPNELAEKEIKLYVQKTAPAAIELPFKQIKIVDSRPDTSKIGFMTADPFFSGKKNLFKKMVLEKGIGESIEDYYNEYYAGSFTQNDFELLIVMKRFWFSGDVDRSDKQTEMNTSMKKRDNVYCKWEYYLGKDGRYLPVKRMDTVFNIDESMMQYISEEFSERRSADFKFVLKALIEILDYSNAVKNFDKQPLKTIDDIYLYNSRINEIPILKDSFYKKGVYLSFEEFKNNKPSIVEYKEKEMRYKLVNTEKYLEDSNGNTISNYWGYSDGKIMRYGMLGNEKMYRVQNTFCFFIKVTGYIVSSGNETFYNSGSSINSSSKRKYEVWIPYQLDMETGQVY